MKDLSYFRSSFLILFVGLGLGYWIGKIDAVLIILILSVLETSLSFDNAVVNAKVLQSMSAVWKHRFLTIGMIIAVFGMRFILPIVIVAITSRISPLEAFNLALTDAESYAHHLEASHFLIAGFGGGFLLMVFLKFFFDQDKEIHWIKVIEDNLKKVAKLESVEVILAFLITYIFASFLESKNAYQFLTAGMFGIICYLLVKGLSGLIKHTHFDENVGHIAQSGLASFIYLEILDASFSFDGVVGAFALSKNIFIIMIGLGIGAMFVRSLTIYFVEKGVLSKFKYLEIGAFWAIGALALAMYTSTIYKVPEYVTGLIGAGFIILSLISSRRDHSKIEEKE